jgi:hypothetical protein
MPKKPKLVKPPKLPKLLDRKISKTGQTRGADDDEVFQNRVSRKSTVLIPYLRWEQASNPPTGSDSFEAGFIALIPAKHYFENVSIVEELASRGLVLGENALIFYETRAEWLTNNPEKYGWTVAKSRKNPLGGQYVVRIAATTATDNSKSAKIIQGFHTSRPKGAGIRSFEYASAQTIYECRLQLEALFWLCHDSIAVAQQNGMNHADAITRSEYTLSKCRSENLLEITKLQEARILNKSEKTICPLCLKELSGQGFFSRVEQAEGRETHDITITQINLFHISELRSGVYNHKPYNLGWGHHHCNVVVKDSGITETLQWIHEVIQRNIDEGHFALANNPGCEPDIEVSLFDE